jgi:hypothetical protein
MVDERDRGEIIEPTPSQQPEMRDLTMGEAVNVMVLNSLGLRHQALNLALSFVHQMPADQCIAPPRCPSRPDARARRWTRPQRRGPRSTGRAHHPQ